MFDDLVPSLELEKQGMYNMIENEEESQHHLHYPISMMESPISGTWATNTNTQAQPSFHPKAQNPSSRTPTVADNVRVNIDSAHKVIMKHDSERSDRRARKEISWY